MSLLKFSSAFDTFESKKPNSLLNPSQFASFSSLIHVTGAYIINPLTKIQQIRVSRLDTDLSEFSESNEVDNGDISSINDLGVEILKTQNPNFGGRNLWKRFRGGKKENPEVNLKFGTRRRDCVVVEEIQTEVVFLCEGENGGGGLDVDMSLELCNSRLRKLEGCSDSESLRFFEWMRVNGKLKQNVTAYNLVFRVLGRRGDWDAAERMIREMKMDLDCEINSRIFNTLIYSCSKRGLVDLGAKWFRMMLEEGVSPNIATFGMLMSLYQKGWNVEEAEFTFLQMRNIGVKCQSAYSAMITIYTRLRLYDKAEEVIGLMREDEVIPNLENWLVLVNAYSQQGKLKEAESVMLSMQEAGFSPNIVAYNTLMTGFGKVSNMEAAQRLFRCLKGVGLEPDETTFRSMIEGWGRAGNYKEVEWYYKKLKGLGFKPNSSNLYTLINLQAKHKDEDGAIRTLADMVDMGCQYSSILGSLLQAYERAGRIDVVPGILKGPLYEHVLFNQTSCSILVMAYAKHSLVDDTIEILQHKRWNDPLFEDNLYHLLMCSCKELGHLENAVKIYLSMPKSKDKPNLHIVGTMIDIYSIMGQFAEAENLYMKLKSSGIALDLIAFSIVVRMYVKSGSLTEACAVLDTMDEQKNIVPDVYLFRDMLRIYQQLGKLDKLADLYYIILKSGITWDQEMYNCVINCCSRALPVDELSRVFDEMLQRRFMPNTITFNVLLYAYGKSKLFKKARKVFLMAKRRGLVDVISYNTLISAYGKNNDLKNLRSSVRKMEFDGFSVSLEAYNSMLDAYGKQGQMENFASVLERMKESSCGSDRYTYNTMINIYGEQGWIDDVAGVLTELKESGLGPDLCSYNTLIKAYGIAGMVEEAVAMVKEMRENGVEPDKITYTNLITALKNNDKFLEAVKWSLWMKQIGL